MDRAARSLAIPENRHWNAFEVATWHGRFAPSSAST
jgi:hypothetical protein